METMIIKSWIKIFLTTQYKPTSAAAIISEYSGAINTSKTTVVPIKKVILSIIWNGSFSLTNLISVKIIITAIAKQIKNQGTE